MRHNRSLLVLAVLLVAAALAGCTGGSGEAGSGDLVVHDDPVPAGMPVMYEFFTTT